MAEAQNNESRAKRNPPNRSEKVCGICLTPMKHNLVRHFKRKHPNEDPVIAKFIDEKTWEKIPYKTKIDMSMAGSDYESSIGAYTENVLGKRGHLHAHISMSDVNTKRLKVA